STSRPRTIARTPALAATTPTVRIERFHSPIAILRPFEVKSHRGAAARSHRRPIARSAHRTTARPAPATRAAARQTSAWASVTGWRRPPPLVLAFVERPDLVARRTLPRSANGGP